MTETVWAIFSLTLIIISELECAYYEDLHGWIARPSTNESYIFLNTTLSWNDASRSCYGMSAELVVIRDEHEKEWLDGALETTTNDDGWWIGMVKTTERSWRWVDGFPVHGPHLKKWMEDKPTEEKQRECAEFTKNITINSVPCNHHKCFICYNESSGLNNLPNPFSYDSFEFHSEPVTWKKAKEKCKKKSWSLLQIHDNKKKGIVNYYLLYDESSCKSWWVGLLGKDSKWTWLDKTALNTSTIPWENSSNSITEAGSCVQINQGFLREFQCDQKLAYICKKFLYRPYNVVLAAPNVCLIIDNYDCSWSTILIILGLVAGVLVILIVIVCCCCFKRRRNTSGPRVHFYRQMSRVDQHIPPGTLNHRTSRPISPNQHVSDEANGPSFSVSHDNTANWVNSHPQPMNDNASETVSSVHYYEDVV